MITLLYKSRNKPSELTILEHLQRRMQLSNNDQQSYNSQKKGYEGELLFDSLTEQLKCNCLVLNDLLLNINNQHFQIDSLLIFKHSIHLFEVKNYSRDYYYTEEKFLMKDQSEITNPLIQLQRAESLLRQLLLKLNFSLPIHSYVIFINPEFMLYLAPPDKPFIFPSQLNRFLKNLNSDQTQIVDSHRKLAKDLASLHILENPYPHLPSYNYQHLRKGIHCSACDSFAITLIGMKCVCSLCGKQEHIDKAVVRIVEEFKLLFPNEKITTGKIHEWCMMILSKKSIQRILKKNFNTVDANRWVYYV